MWNLCRTLPFPSIMWDYLMQGANEAWSNRGLGVSTLHCRQLIGGVVSHYSVQLRSFLDVNVFLYLKKKKKMNTSIFKGCPFSFKCSDACPYVKARALLTAQHTPSCSAWFCVLKSMSFCLRVWSALGCYALRKTWISLTNQPHLRQQCCSISHPVSLNFGTEVLSCTSSPI